MDRIAPCPHCGVSDMVFANVRACGWCSKLYNLAGEAVETDTDGLWFTDTKTLRCAGCGKVRRDVERIPGGRGIRMKARAVPIPPLVV